jgi:hypothetical protein
MSSAASSRNELLFLKTNKSGVLFLRQKRNVKMSSLGIVIGPTTPGEPDRRPHFFEELQVIIKTAFGNTNLLGTIGRRSRTLVRNKVIEADQAVK